MRCFTSAVTLAVAAMLGFAQPTTASGLFSTVTIALVQLSGVESQAQLATQLNAQGYDHVILTPIYPTPLNPHPELNPGLANDLNVPVHAGWNGVASKGGQIVQVYATHS